jgi:hypothetical protein
MLAPVMEVASIIGCKELRMLLRFTQLRVAQLAMKLG